MTRVAKQPLPPLGPFSISICSSPAAAGRFDFSAPTQSAPSAKSAVSLLPSAKSAKNCKQFVRICGQEHSFCTFLRGYFFSARPGRVSHVPLRHRPIQLRADIPIDHRGFVATKVDRFGECAAAGIQAEGPLVPRAGHYAVRHLARRHVPSRVGATVFRDNESLGVGQSEYGEFKVANDNVSSATDGAVIHGDELSPG